MEVRRFHQPRWADVCDECIGHECICGKASRMVEGCECSQNRQQLMDLLKMLNIDSPEKFKGVYQQEHKPCASCSKHIYEQLKKEKASRAVTRPKQEHLHQAKQKQAQSLPKSNSSPVKPGSDQCDFDIFYDPYENEPAKVKGIKLIDLIEGNALSPQSQSRTEPIELLKALPQTTPFENTSHANPDEFTIVGQYKKPQKGTLRAEPEKVAPNKKKVVTLSVENLTPWRKLKHMRKEYSKYAQAQMGLFSSENSIVQSPMGQGNMAQMCPPGFNVGFVAMLYSLPSFYTNNVFDNSHAHCTGAINYDVLSA